MTDPEPVQKKRRHSGSIVSFTKTNINLYPTLDKTSCLCDITFTPSTGMVSLYFESHGDLQHIIADNRLQFFIQHELMRLVRQGIETEGRRALSELTQPGTSLDTASQVLLLSPEQEETLFQQYRADEINAQLAYESTRESDHFIELFFFLQIVTGEVARYVVDNLSSHYKDFARVANDYKAKLYSVEALDELGTNEATNQLNRDVRIFYKQFIEQYTLTYFPCTKLDFTTFQTALRDAQNLKEVYPEELDDGDKEELSSELHAFLDVTATETPETSFFADSMLGSVLEYYVLRGRYPDVPQLGLQEYLLQMFPEAQRSEEHWWYAADYADDRTFLGALLQRVHDDVFGAPKAQVGLVYAVMMKLAFLHLSHTLDETLMLWRHTYFNDDYKRKTNLGIVSASTDKSSHDSLVLHSNEQDSYRQKDSYCMVLRPGCKFVLTEDATASQGESEIIVLDAVLDGDVQQHYGFKAVVLVDKDSEAVSQIGKPQQMLLRLRL